MAGERAKCPACGGDHSDADALLMMLQPWRPCVEHLAAQIRALAPAPPQAEPAPGCETCGDGLFVGSTTLGTLQPCPECFTEPAPKEAEGAGLCGWCFGSGKRQNVAPSVLKDEACSVCGGTGRAGRGER